jgi:hypothetical protein
LFLENLFNLRCATLREGHEYWTRLKSHASDKHSSLFDQIVSDGEIKFYNIVFQIGQQDNESVLYKYKSGGRLEVIKFNKVALSCFQWLRKKSEPTTVHKRYFK